MRKVISTLHRSQKSIDPGGYQNQMHIFLFLKIEFEKEKGGSHMIDLLKLLFLPIILVWKLLIGILKLLGLSDIFGD